ncbi:hypothetical protein DFJ77DRAFT_250439 [Powellomyces hirtus]|nr:hypothetical protein DFJ77DRAFT_250439 [Powellomyces hirtus]
MAGWLTHSPQSYCSLDNRILQPPQCAQGSTCVNPWLYTVHYPRVRARGLSYRYCSYGTGQTKTGATPPKLESQYIRTQTEQKKKQNKKNLKSMVLYALRLHSYSYRRTIVGTRVVRREMGDGGLEATLCPVLLVPRSGFVYSQIQARTVPVQRQPWTRERPDKERAGQFGDFFVIYFFVLPAFALLSLPSCLVCSLVFSLFSFHQVN